MSKGCHISICFVKVSLYTPNKIKIMLWSNRRTQQQWQFMYPELPESNSSWPIWWSTKQSIQSLTPHRQGNPFPREGLPLLSHEGIPVWSVWPLISPATETSHCLGRHDKKQQKAVFIKLTISKQLWGINSQGNSSTVSNVVPTFEKQKRYRSWGLERCLKLEIQWKRNCG